MTPGSEAIAAAVALVDYRKVQLDDGAGTIRLPGPTARRSCCAGAATWTS